MKTTQKLFLGLLILAFVSVQDIKADDLNTKKMEQVTRAILDIFVNDTTDKNGLRKYISEEWLDKKNLNIKKFKINNYSPQKFEIIYSGSDICIATIGGESWSHLLVFKFTDEYGTYRVIPRGVSEVANDYIDPWWSVNDYICQQPEPEIEEK